MGGKKRKTNDPKQTPSNRPTKRHQFAAPTTSPAPHCLTKNPEINPSSSPTPKPTAPKLTRIIRPTRAPVCDAAPVAPVAYMGVFHDRPVNVSVTTGLLVPGSFLTPPWRECSGSAGSSVRLSPALSKEEEKPSSSSSSSALSSVSWREDPSGRVVGNNEDNNTAAMQSHEQSENPMAIPPSGDDTTAETHKKQRAAANTTTSEILGKGPFLAFREPDGSEPLDSKRDPTAVDESRSVGLLPGGPSMADQLFQGWTWPSVPPPHGRTWRR